MRRFPGADIDADTIEAMMQDRKALQAGTSHFLGQNFARAQEIKFQDQNGQEVYAWTTSWGMTTRLVGALVMTHSDDDGLVIPPRLAPQHVVILPIYRSDDERSQVLPYCEGLQQQLQQQSYDGSPIRVMIDDRDLRGGEKTWQHIKKGVPIRVEVGPRDLASGSVFVGRRDQGPKEKQSLPKDEFVGQIDQMLSEMQSSLFARADQMVRDHTQRIDSLDDFKSYFTAKNKKKPEIHGGFAHCHWSECPEMHALLKELKVTVRCVPLEGADEPGTCLFSGQPSTKRAIFAKSY